MPKQPADRALTLRSRVKLVKVLWCPHAVAEPVDGDGPAIHRPIVK